MSKIYFIEFLVLQLGHKNLLFQDKLVDEGICDAESAPSVSSINRIVRNKIQQYHQPFVQQHQHPQQYFRYGRETVAANNGGLLVVSGEIKEKSGLETVQVNGNLHKHSTGGGGSDQPLIRKRKEGSNLVGTAGDQDGRGSAIKREKLAAMNGARKRGEGEQREGKKDQRSDQQQQVLEYFSD